MLDGQNSRVAIDENNPSIKRIEDRCVKCGLCANVCSEYVSVNNNYSLAETKVPVCVNCGQCIKVCPSNSIVGKDDYKQVAKEISKEDNEKLVEDFLKSK